MGEAAQIVPTLPISKRGPVGHPLISGDTKSPAALSSTAIQNMDRALRDYHRSTNELLNASSDLLALCGTVSRLSGARDLNVTRAEIARSIIDLKYRVVRLDYPPSVAENLCLLFAIVLDEFIMTSPWGEDTGWENLTLVANLFGFRDGGDRFYNVADRALMQPKALHDFLQIVYVFLKLGYRGRFVEGHEQERDRLIGRLENALDLNPREKPPAEFGRVPEATQSPARVLGATAKLVGALATVAIITAAMFIGIAQEIRTSAGKIEARVSQIDGAGTPEFVFSSLTGKTEMRVNE